MKLVLNLCFEIRVSKFVFWNSCFEINVPALVFRAAAELGGVVLGVGGICRRGVLAARFSYGGRLWRRIFRG